MKRTFCRLSITLGIVVMSSWLWPADAHAQSREQKVRNDKAKFEASGYWIYNDLAKGLAEGKSSGKPVLVVLRCIPCEECVKLDDDLVDNDEQLRPLLDKFVRVRLVSTNGLDLSLFQYDTDQSFAVFMLNADGTIYGRYGTRSDQKEWSNDVSIAGLTQALDGALVLHKQYPANKEALAAKRGAAPEFPVPEQFPTLKGKFGPTLDYQGNVVRSCIHCHQIGDAQRAYHLDKSGAIPEKVLFPYPHPKALGLILSPQERATVLRVDEGSPAAAAGFKPGDRILKLAGQPLLSIADVQWVLHNTPFEGGSLEATVARSTSELPIRVTLKLDNGWRRRDDIAWRASSWELRRYALGGLYLKTIDDDLREELEIKPDTMALRAQHVGEYAPHDRAKRAGLRKGDIILSFDGRTDFARETDLLVYALAQYQSGKKFEIDVLRDGQRLKIQLPAGAK